MLIFDWHNENALPGGLLRNAITFFAFVFVFYNGPPGSAFSLCQLKISNKFG